MIQIKELVYLVWQVFIKNIWRISGGSRLKAMGLALNLHPNTVWPGRRGLRLPHENCRSKMVAFADLVQAHALCNAVEFINNPVIVDVGAHHGEYAVLLGGLIKSRGAGVVIAIEPDVANVNILKSNITRNNLDDIVHIVESAVLDVNGTTDFISHGSQSHLLTGNHNDKNVLSKIKVETLRDILTRFKLDKVDVLLIDVEGAELPVLKGFPWEKIKPSMIFCEMHPYNWPLFGYAGKDMSTFLQQHQYRCLDMYFHEQERFDDLSYIGPCLFLPK